MPLFEFRCRDCNQRFEDLVLNMHEITQVICPACGSEKTIKEMSSFAAFIGAGSHLQNPRTISSACDAGGT